MNKIILIVAVFLTHLISPLFGQSVMEKLYFDGNYTDVVNQVENQQQLGLSTTSDLLLAGRSCEQLFHYEQAIGFYQRILNTDSLNRPVNEAIGNCWNNLGNKTKALQSYSQIIPTDTFNLAFWGKYAGVLMDLERYADAQRIYEKLLSQDTENNFFLRKLAIAVFNQKEYEKAVVYLNQYLFRNPNDLKMLMAQANCFQRIGIADSSAVYLKQILKLDSTHLDALSKLAYIEFKNYKDYDLAVVHYRTINRLTGYSDETYLTNLGICEFFVGNFEASSSILESLAKESSDPFIHLYAGLSFQKLGDIEKAMESIKTAVELVIPLYSVDFYHYLAEVYALNRKYPESIAMYEKVLETDSTRTVVLYEMALIYDSWKRDFGKALGYYELYVVDTTNQTAQYKYAKNRIQRIKEDQFFEGK